MTALNMIVRAGIDADRGGSLIVHFPFEAVADIVIDKNRRYFRSRVCRSSEFSSVRSDQPGGRCHLDPMPGDHGLTHRLACHVRLVVMMRDCPPMALTVIARVVPATLTAANRNTSDISEPVGETGRERAPP